LWTCPHLRGRRAPRDAHALAPWLAGKPQGARNAHDNPDNVRQNFALQTTSDGALGNDETEVFAAANDLKNAMGAAVAYTGNPNAATLAQFTTKYQTAVAEWNSGVSDIWKTAGSAKPPTL
jgi:glycosidase